MLSSLPENKILAAQTFLWSVKPWWRKYGERFTLRAFVSRSTSDSKFGGFIFSDNNWNIYVDTQFAQIAKLEEISAAIEREYYRQSRNLTTRLKSMSAKAYEEYGKISAEMEICSALLEEEKQMQEQFGSIEQLIESFSLISLDSSFYERWGITTFPYLRKDTVWNPEELGFKPGLTAESYFQLLFQGENTNGEDDSDTENDNSDGKQKSSNTESQENDKSQDDQKSESSESNSNNENDIEEQDSSNDTQELNTEDNSEDSEENNSEKNDNADAESKASEESENNENDNSNNLKEETNLEQESDDNGTENSSKEEYDNDDSNESENKQDSETTNTNDSENVSSGSSQGNAHSEEHSEEHNEENSDSESLSSDDKTLDDKLEELKNSSERRWYSRDHEPPPFYDEVRYEGDLFSDTQDDDAINELTEDIHKFQELARISGKPGFAPGNAQVDFADEISMNKTVEWSSKWENIMSHAVDTIKIKGGTDVSYSVRNPNQPRIGPIMMGLYDNAVKIGVIIDNSGSMEQFIQKTFGTFMGVVLDAVADTGEGVIWATVDVGLVEAGVATKVDQVSLNSMMKGWGGTVIEEVLEQMCRGELNYKGINFEQPDVVILLTDCLFRFPWGDAHKPPVEPEILIASMLTKEEIERTYNQLPEWVVDGENFIYIPS